MLKELLEGKDVRSPLYTDKGLARVLTDFILELPINVGSRKFKVRL